MSSSFAVWLQNEISEKYGSVGEFLALPEFDPLTAPRWIVGAVQPSIEGQIKIADALDVPLAEIRNQLKLPHSEFGEYLIRRIIATSTVMDFCREADLQLTKVHKWIQGKSYPVRGDGSREVAMKTALWLKKKGDARKLDKIMDEVLCKIEEHRPPRAKRKSKRAKNLGAPKSGSGKASKKLPYRKKATVCESAKIA